MNDCLQLRVVVVIEIRMMFPKKSARFQTFLSYRYFANMEGHFGAFYPV